MLFGFHAVYITFEYTSLEKLNLDRKFYNYTTTMNLRWCLLSNYILFNGSSFFALLITSASISPTDCYYLLETVNTALRGSVASLHNWKASHTERYNESWLCNGSLARIENVGLCFRRAISLWSNFLLYCSYLEVIPPSPNQLTAVFLKKA